MLTIQQAYAELKSEMLKVYDAGEAISVSAYLMEHGFGVSQKDLLIHPGNLFTHVATFRAHIQRLKRMEPVQYVCGVSFFCGLQVKTGPEVLIPRPETEALVQLLLQSERHSDVHIADICTGSGCIAMALRKHLPGAHITAVDISEPALKLATESEALNFNVSQIQWKVLDVLQGSWPYHLPDVVVCNPPYITVSEKTDMETNVLAYEPHLALFAEGNDPLVFYKKVLEMFAGNSGIRFYFELNPATASNLETYCIEKGLKCALHIDLYGKIRFALISS